MNRKEKELLRVFRNDINRMFIKTKGLQPSKDFLKILLKYFNYEFYPLTCYLDQKDIDEICGWSKSTIKEIY